MRNKIRISLILSFLSLLSLKAQQYEFIRSITLDGMPKGISYQSVGTFYTALSNKHQVVKIDKNGVVLLRIGSDIGSTNTLLNNPTDVDVDKQGNIYVADSGNKRVQVFDSNGNYIRTHSFIPAVNGVTISPDGKLYVALQTEIQIFDGASYVGSITKPSSDVFRIIRKVHFDQTGKMYILDMNTGAMKISSINGTTANIEYLIKKKNGKNTYNRLAYITTTTQGNIILSVNEERIADNTYPGIIQFNNIGICTDTIGQIGISNNPDRFNKPYGVVIGENDSLYVADSDNSAIKVWSAVDNKAPQISNASFGNISRSSINLSLSCNEQATLKYKIQPATDTPPTVETLIQSDDKMFISEINKIVIYRLKSPKENNLKVYYILVDKAGNTTDVSVSDTINTNQPLTISNLIVADKQINESTFGFSANDKGSIYFMALPYKTDMPVPSADEVVNNQFMICDYSQVGEISKIKTILKIGESTIIYAVIKSGSEVSNVISCIICPYNDIDVIRNKYISLLLGSGLTENSDVNLLLRHNALLTTFSKAHQKSGDFNPDTQLPLFNLDGESQTPDIILVRDLVANVLFPLSLSYNLKGTPTTPNPDYQNPATLKEIIRLYEYLSKRGFVSGCTLPFSGGGVYLGLTGYYYASLLMRTELAQAGMSDQVTAMMDWGTRWVSADDKTWGPNIVNNSGKSDGIRTLYNNRLLYLLTVEDKDLNRENKMMLLTTTLNNNFQTGSAWNGFLKPDYTGYHHLGIWGNAYITEALHTGAKMANVLNNTTYSLSKSSIENIANGLLAYRDYSCKYDISRGLCGRFPNQLNKLFSHIPAYAYLYEITSGEIQQRLGDALSELYLQDYSLIKKHLIQDVVCNINFTGGLGTLEKIINFKKDNSATVTGRNLNRTFPFGAMQVHRRSDWMAMVKGYNKYVWDFETNGSENWYGRNQSAGQLSIYSGVDKEGIVTAEASGVGYNGWDWSHTPGTTTFAMPLADMFTEAKNYEWAKFSPESFACGVTNNQNGVYAMKFADIRQAYDYKNDRKWLGVKLSANKSFFFFDDLIIVLGSDIKNNHDKYSAHTTLFQNMLTDPAAKVQVNNNSFTSSGMLYDELSTSAAQLIDMNNNGYYLPDAKGLHVHRAVQNSRNDRNTADTQGEYATAWIDHGKSLNAAYEYAVWVRSGDKISQLAATPQSFYTTLRKDSIAHIVHGNRTSERGYAIFKADSVLNDNIIRSASAPCLAWVANDTQNNIKLSVSNPELGYYSKGTYPYQVWSIPANKMYLPSEVQPVIITLEGNWSSSNLPLNVELTGYDKNKNSTDICFNGKNSESLSIELYRENASSTDEIVPKNYKIYPNPTKDKLYISRDTMTDDDTSVTLTDLAGRVLISRKLSENEDNFILELTRFHRGIYILKVNNCTQQIILQ